MEILIFLTLFVTYGYFGSGEGWNPKSRLALTYALVERGSVQIDPYWNLPDLLTRDVAVYENHVYSDKIIGTSLLGVPAFMIVKGVELARGKPFHPNVRRYIVNLFSVGAVGAGAGVLLFWLLLSVSRAPASRQSVIGAAVISLAVFLGTQLLLYGTVFMAYAPVAFFELALLLLVQQRRGDAPPVSCGLLGGAALLCDYTAVFSVAGLTIWLFVNLKRRSDIWKTFAATIAVLLPFFVYVYAIFGRFAIPYQYEFHPMFRWFMEQGVMGATSPKPIVLYLITLHPYRGLFFHSPVLLVALAGLAIMLRRPAQRLLGLVLAGIILVFLLFNSAYYMWWGGWSFGPRILIPAVPLLAIALQPVWESHALSRVAILLSSGWGIVVHLVVLAVTAQPRDLNEFTTLDMLLCPEWSNSYVWIFHRFILPGFVAGELQPNLGRMMGIPGGWSLVPLMLLWVLAGWSIVRATDSHRAQSCA